jgi:hypothetical protein
MRKTLGITSALLVSLSLAACGGPDSVSIDDLPEDLIDAFCDRAVRCGLFVDEATCKAGLDVSSVSVIRAVEAGRADYDGEAAAACIDKLRNAACDNTLEENRVQPEECDDAFDGNVADGGACFDDEECVSGECEIPSCQMACCTGACAATIPVPAIGQACPNGVCGDDAFCSEAGTCTALVANGGACLGNNDECSYGLYCTEGGTCADAPNRGQACPEGICADIGDRCDGTTCVALSGRGGPCSEGILGFFDCQQPLACNQTSLTCVDPPTVGQACEFFCASGAFCNDAATCEATKANGTACESNNECTSLYCDEFAATPACADEPICG